MPEDDPNSKLVKYIEKLYECTPQYISNHTKVIVNGNWIGIITEPESAITLLKNYRRNGLIPIYTSISWEIQTNTLYIYSDAETCVACACVCIFDFFDCFC